MRVMGSKIRYDFNELSRDSANQLLEMLFAMARQYRENRTTLRNEICLDIATLLLRWSDLTNIVHIAVENIGASGNDYMLLNVLGMLPVEVKSKRVGFCDAIVIRCRSSRSNAKRRSRTWSRTRKRC